MITDTEARRATALREANRTMTAAMARADADVTITVTLNGEPLGLGTEAVIGIAKRYEMYLETGE